jgi:hypothetical protein
MEDTMLRLIAVGFALTIATSAQAMPVAPLHQPDGLITQVRQGCGPGRVRIHGVCVTRGYGYYGYRPYGYYGYRYRPYGYYGYRRYGYYGARPYRGYWAGRAYRRWR